MPEDAYTRMPVQGSAPFQVSTCCASRATRNRRLARAARCFFWYTTTQRHRRTRARPGLAETPAHSACSGGPARPLPIADGAAECSATAVRPRHSQPRWRRATRTGRQQSPQPSRGCAARGGLQRPGTAQPRASRLAAEEPSGAMTLRNRWRGRGAQCAGQQPLTAARNRVTHMTRVPPAGPPPPALPLCGGGGDADNATRLGVVCLCMASARRAAAYRCDAHDGDAADDAIASSRVAMRYAVVAKSSLRCKT